MSSIASRITKARRLANMNQRELAQKANITEANLSRYENGIREPKSAVLMRLATALDVSADYLLGLCEDKAHDNNETKDFQKDISILLDVVMSTLEEDNLVFEGNSVSKDVLDGILYSIRMCKAFARDSINNK